MRLGVRTLRLLLSTGLLVGLSSVPAPAGGEDRARLEVEVTAKESGEPIENATVYVKFKEERFLRRDKRLEWSLKTNREGKAVFPAVPEGRVLVQVVADEWKTYGKFYTIQGPKHVLEIRLSPPKKWY